ncbi:MAG: VWA domain-containing protein [Eudoraea sp.]|nr:VWA domain-containing protein [Eudoraea sp.]NNJ39522.1 VWA domain-containing protein [Eudoraea sp.]
MKIVKLLIAGAALLFSTDGTTTIFLPGETGNKSTTQLQNSEYDHPRGNTVKIALLLDTSNSMDGLIRQAKAQLWDIVNKFTYAKCGTGEKPNLQIALYQYGNDGLPSQEGYLQQVIGFTSDLDLLSEKLFSLTTNGGEEFCGKVIHTAVRQLNWGKNEDHLKMIFIAGNEPFTQGKLDYRNAVGNAKEKDIIINTIFCGEYHLGIRTGWKNGADLGGGDYLTIDHNRRIVHIKTPYDDIILKLNKQLNRTYISYGAQGAHKMAMQETQDQNAESLNEVVAVKRAVSKSSSIYNNSSWDLIDAADDAEFEVDKLRKEDLPPELKGKSSREIEHFIQTKKAERQRIQSEIQDLNVKREAFISDRKQSEKGELENAMLKAIEKQGARKNIRWE